MRNHLEGRVDDVELLGDACCVLAGILNIGTDKLGYSLRNELFRAHYL